MPKTGATAVDRLAGDLYLVLRQLVRRLRAAGSGRELGWSHLSALGWLEDGPRTIAALARLDNVKPQSMGVTIRGLEKEGLVEGRPHPTDRRQIVFSLTRAGRKVRVEATRVKREWLAGAIEEKLSAADRRALRDAVELLRRLQQSPQE